MAERPTALEHLRSERGLSQEELARRSGVHAATIARIERRENRPRLATLYRLARALEVDVDELREPEEEAA